MITIESMAEAKEFILAREKPLAMYIFATESAARDILEHTSSGGACINDTIMHIANEHLPFGGVGNSGMGRYHGRDSLYTFSHRRAVATTPTWLDVPFRYMPYRLFSWIKRLL
jgi:aldehyde dehydrogenase (NAD+)